MTELQQMKLERDQAVCAIKFILDSKKDLFTFFNALDAAKALLTKLEVHDERAA